MIQDPDGLAIELANVQQATGLYLTGAITNGLDPEFLKGKVAVARRPVVECQGIGRETITIVLDVSPAPVDPSAPYGRDPVSGKPLKGPDAEPTGEGPAIVKTQNGA